MILGHLPSCTLYKSSVENKVLQPVSFNHLRILADSTYQATFVLLALNHYAYYYLSPDYSAHWSTQQTIT